MDCSLNINENFFVILLRKQKKKIHNYHIIIKMLHFEYTRLILFILTIKKKTYITVFYK